MLHQRGRCCGDSAASSGGCRRAGRRSLRPACDLRADCRALRPNPWTSSRAIRGRRRSTGSAPTGGAGHLARTLYAGRVSLSIGFAAALISIVVGASSAQCRVLRWFGGRPRHALHRCRDDLPGDDRRPDHRRARRAGHLRNAADYPPAQLADTLASSARSSYRCRRTKHSSPPGRSMRRAAHDHRPRLPEHGGSARRYAIFGVVDAILWRPDSFLGLGVQPPTAS